MRFANVFHGATVIHRVDYSVIGTWWVFFFVPETLLYSAGFGPEPARFPACGVVEDRYRQVHSST